MLDFETIGVLAVLILSVTQILKYHTQIATRVTPFVGAGIGILLSVLWYLVKGKLESHDAPLHVDWINLYQACANGCVAVTGAAAGFIAQKFAPIPNLLPTASDINQTKLDSAVTKQQQVVDAVEKGLDPVDAKKLVGLEHQDPPADAKLEEIQPELPEGQAQ